MRGNRDGLVQENLDKQERVVAYIVSRLTRLPTLAMKLSSSDVTQNHQCLCNLQIKLSRRFLGRWSLSGQVSGMVATRNRKGEGWGRSREPRAGKGGDGPGGPRRAGKGGVGKGVGGECGGEYLASTWRVLGESWRVLGEYLASTWRVLGEYLASLGEYLASLLGEHVLGFFGGWGGPGGRGGAGPGPAEAEENFGENRSFCHNRGVLRRELRRGEGVSNVFCNSANVVGLLAAFLTMFISLIDGVSIIDWLMPAKP